MTTDATAVRRPTIRWAGIFLSIFIAAFLLFEGYWFATLRGSAYGIPERQARMQWWGVAEGACFAGVLLCDAFAASLFAFRRRGREGGTTSILGNSPPPSSRWKEVFAGFVLSAVATTLVALVWTLL